LISKKTTGPTTFTGPKTEWLHIMIQSAVEPSGFQTDKVVLLSAGHFSHDVFSSFLVTLLPLLIAKFQLSMLLAGSLVVIFRFPSLLDPLIGVICDRRNIGRLAVWAPAATAAGMSLLGLAPDYGLLCLLVVGCGVSAAIYHVFGPVMIARFAGVDLGKGMSFWMTGGELARTAGPLFAVWTVTRWGLEGSYRVMLFGIAASLVLWLQLRGTSSRTAAQHRIDYTAAWHILRPIMIPVTGIVLFHQFMSATLFSFLPTFVVSSGKSLWMGGGSLALLEGCGTLGTLIGGIASDRLGRRRVLLLALPVSCAAMVLAIYAPGGLFLPAIIVLGLTLFAANPVLLAVVQDHAARCRGTANGLFMCINAVAIAVVTFAVGALADWIGLKMAFTLSALLGLCGIPIIFKLSES